MPSTRRAPAAGRVGAPHPESILHISELALTLLAGSFFIVVLRLLGIRGRPAPALSSDDSDKFEVRASIGIGGDGTSPLGSWLGPAVAAFLIGVAAENCAGLLVRAGYWVGVDPVASVLTEDSDRARALRSDLCLELARHSQQTQTAAIERSFVDRLPPEVADSLRRALPSSGDAPKHVEFATTRAIYYAAKSWCLAVSSGHAEVHRWYMRAVTLRSLVFLMLVAVLLRAAVAVPFLRATLRLETAPLTGIALAGALTTLIALGMLAWNEDLYYARTILDAFVREAR